MRQIPDTRQQFRRAPRTSGFRNQNINGFQKNFKRRIFPSRQPFSRFRGRPFQRQNFNRQNPRQKYQDNQLDNYFGRETKNTQNLDSQLDNYFGRATNNQQESNNPTQLQFPQLDKYFGRVSDKSNQQNEIMIKRKKDQLDKQLQSYWERNGNKKKMDKTNEQNQDQNNEVKEDENLKEVDKK